MKQSASKFAPLQIGLTPFYQSDQGLKAQPFNVNLFPLYHSLRFNSGSLQFLGSNAFDLNEWIDGGVPYIQKERWTQMQEQQKKQIRQIRTNLMSKNENKQLIKQDQLCFSEVIKLISELKKPIIGHNCLFDLMYLLSGFVSDLPPTLAEFKSAISSLFPTIFDTKTIVTNSLSLGSLVGNISSLQQIAELVLNHEDFRQNPTISLNKKHNAYSLEDKEIYHEAGFDSLMTGIVFARIVAFLQSDSKFKSSLLEASSSGKKSKRRQFDYRVVNQYRNKVKIGNIKSPLDLQDLEQQDNQSREHVYAVVDVPSSLSSQQVEDQLHSELKVGLKIYRVYGNNIYFFTVPDPDEQNTVFGEQVEIGGKKVRLMKYEKYIEEMKAKGI